PCGWETNEAEWPSGGEVDILEGVNDQGTDQITLHTSPGCTMPGFRAMTGTPLQLDCNTQVNGNTGCGVKVAQGTSFGPTFNANGGGWYAMERTNQFISVWFWARNNPSVPADVRVGGVAVDTDSWVRNALSLFPCDIASHFAPSIIINLTLCNGDWAGAVYGSTCPGTCFGECPYYVSKNPGAFTDAYFQFNSINVYN
ncbi:hypothetical protein K438DRAFT_1593769, partial [Mycena galopus ATCC 62051]